MKSAAGSGNAAFVANHAGSVCPCGLTIGRLRTASYSVRAIALVAGSAGNRRSGERSSGISGKSSALRASRPICPSGGPARSLCDGLGNGFRGAEREKSLEPARDGLREARLVLQVLVEDRVD